MFDDTDETLGTVQGDAMGNGLMMFVMLLLLLIVFINDPKKKDSENLDPPNQGVIKAEVFWPNNQNIDVDLWTAGPIGKPVGYSNKGSELWNLLRDDLGTNTDASGKNMEVSYTRGIWDGEYVVNLHLYDGAKPAAGVWLDDKNLPQTVLPSKLPVPCRVILSYKENRDAAEQQVAVANVSLTRTGHEVTVFRFMVKDFKILKETMNHLHKPLRAKDKATQNWGGQ